MIELGILAKELIVFAHYQCYFFHVNKKIEDKLNVTNLQNNKR